MFIHAFPSGPFQTNAYVVACPDTQHAAIIDPGVDSSHAIMQSIAKHQFIPKSIIITHSHWDHIAEVSQLKDHYNIPVYIHKDDSANLLNPGSDGLPCWIPIQGVKADYFLEDHQTLTIGNLTFEVIHTPGHSPGGVCLYCKAQNILISGDTLFKGSIGNLSFPTCDADHMWVSLDKIAKLPPETKVYPGHGPSTTIGHESWLPRAKDLFGD